MTIHGGDIYTYMEKTGELPLDFSANINPMGLPKSVKSALIKSLDTYTAYPDIHCRALTKAVSELEQVNGEQLVFGNGAADIIFKLVYSRRPKKALVLAPTFHEYQAALEAAGCEIFYHDLAEQEGFELSRTILPALADMDMVFICNPNNPTGTVASNQLLREIAKGCQQERAVLVIDECFMDFVEREDSFKPFLGEFPNVVILRAFTKIFAMAGLRLGYCISENPALLAGIQAAGQPWSVSAPAQVAGVAAAGDRAYITHSLKAIAKERQYLRAELNALGFKVYESAANYIFFRGKPGLCEQLLKKGILIRSCSNYRGLNEEYYRIAVKSHEDNMVLIGELRNVQ